MVRGRKRLFVDGYNVLYAWQRGGERSSADLETVRQEIIDAVRSLVDVEAVDATVVFDGREAFDQLEATGSNCTVRVVFARAGLTADGAIERLVAANGNADQCTVVTADRLERETVTASGAECITPEELARWVERCRQRLRRRPSGGARIENKLPL